MLGRACSIYVAEEEGIGVEGHLRRRSVPFPLSISSTLWKSNFYGRMESEEGTFMNSPPLSLLINT